MKNNLSDDIKKTPIDEFNSTIASSEPDIISRLLPFFEKDEVALFKEIKQFNKVENLILQGVYHKNKENNFGFFINVGHSSGKKIRYPFLDKNNSITNIFIAPNNLLSGNTYSFEVKIAKREERIKQVNPFLLEAKIQNIKDKQTEPKFKIGKVKFFDHVNNFGIIIDLVDGIEYYVPSANVLTPPINNEYIVVYEALKSKDNRCRATNVSKNIPVFIFNKENTSNSCAYPLFDDQLEVEIALTIKAETGFTFLNAKYYKTHNWNGSIIPSIMISKTETISFGKKIIKKLLPRLNEYKSTIKWLSSLLQAELNEDELNSIYSCVITNWRFEVLLSLDRKSLQQVLKKLLLEQGPTKQVEESYKYLIGQGWDINSKEELAAVTIFLEAFKTAFPSIPLEETNFRCNSNHFYIELYFSGSIKELSEARTKQYIQELKTEDEKAGFIEKLPSDKILSYYYSFPSLSNYQEKYITDTLESEFSKIDFLCFDLESDGEKINEFAWKNRLEVKSQADFKKKEEGISELVSLINFGSLTIGQNIKEFDLVILANHGATPSSDMIWDTLEMEMLLNPERFSYGLKTKHNAKSDTELTYRLFKNQLSRIIISQNTYTDIKELLPSKAIDLINQISNNPIWALLNFDYFLLQANEFFRPNPTNQNISEQTFNQLTEKLNEEGNKVVVAPEFLWNTLSHQFDLTFSNNKSFLFCLNKEKIEEILGDDKLLKAILFRFVDTCISKGIQPYFQHLPIVIRLKLTSEQLTLICDNIDVDFGNVNQKPICIKPTDIEILKQLCDKDSDIKVIIVGNELYNLTSKLQLGQDFDFATIFDRLKNEPIWLQMSGGKSFINLEQSHCRQLGITEFPEFIQNIWLEKIGKGKFKVWCNLNFEACINDLPINEAHYIDWVDETFTKTNSFIIRPDARKSGYIAEQKRVNPESLYRKIYWVYQFKLFEGIGNTNNPKVLIVNDELETEKLSAYARRKGYFIPDTKASLARQVELLHTHRSPNKLLIASFLTLDKIISSNYTGPLDFIWDSFLLQEKLQMLRGKVNKEDIELTENVSYIPSLKGDIANKADFDTYKLFRLHKPLVDYYYKMVIDNNQESNLFLCDTRLADFIGIEKSLELKSKHVRLWNRIEDYEADYKEASDFFPSDLLKDNDFDIVEAKQILRQLFLPKNDNGDFFEWYDYQDKCLNDILPAKKDLLISLPTGAGKSVLFQAPALFRSTFTNKLNIVISPLRALMHDQVEILHEMGLYSNVEYLSGDKSQEEIKDVYRRIVGGEITLLYITPERFRSRSFENCLLTRLDADSGLEYVVFDEAHCISQWGQEFRPDYLNAGRIIADKSKSYSMTKLLFSATISEQVFEEISKLMPGVETVEGTEKSYNPVRDHIKMDFKHNVVEDDRLLEVANYLKSGKFNPELSRAIIFVKSRKKVEECSLIMSDSLKDVFGTDCSFAEKVGAFHAGMDAEDRKDTYEKYKTGEILILFATKAFGMGMDIPNIHFVTHYSPPSTFEDFLQEVGRAGRNEKQRFEAGFNNSENPIKTLCLTANNDFAKLKAQLHESRISWHEVKDIKQVLEEYIARFKSLTPDTEIPVAVPFNLYSNIKGSTDDETDTKFRIALHWLERLERIKLGYFTITHLEFDSASLNKLAERINKCPDNDCEKVCHAILELLPSDAQSSEVLQISIASLRSISKLSLENLFSALLKNHSAEILKLLQDVVIEPTKIRLDETNHCKNILDANEKYPALQVVFSLASKILSSVPSNSSKFFEGEELDDFLKESVNENINFKKLPWTKKDNVDGQTKEYNNYIKDVFKKRSKHAFTIIRLLGKTKHETKMEKVTDGNRKGRIKQSIFNGFHKKEEWSNKITQLEKDCIKLLDYVAKQNFDKNIKNFNWPDIISDLDFKGNVQYLSDLLFILSVLGYSKTGGLLPSGIEIYLHSTELIDETQDENNDKIIYNEFNETQEIRELKLISLQVLSKLDDDKKDAFIKGFFASKTKLELINHLQNIGEIDDEHPIFKAFRGDAIKYQEVNRLNDEQREIYFSDVNQNINVVAGPGSGKTHTLTLRVARLVYYKFANPEEILVLAYNRAVVSELKERLGKLFKDLGFGNLAKRIRIVTFHGLAKKYCQEQLEGLKFDEWEPTLLQILKDTPGVIMNQLSPLKHILVDEFQDINEVRMNLLYRLNELTKAHLFIIGDPNQSIYGYDRTVMDPYHYYEVFDSTFTPAKFTLLDNHRSYPAILNLASQILTLPEDHQHSIPRATKKPNENFIEEYVEVIDNISKPEIKWWDKIQSLTEETITKDDGKALKYKQIAILFRTNNEVYRGFQKIKGLKLANIRIRIQGSLPYEFTRIRECHALLSLFEKMEERKISSDFIEKLKETINDLVVKNPNWNDYYLKLVFCIVVDFFKNAEDEFQNFRSLIDYISELSYKDDGQLRKIYDCHIFEFEEENDDIEVVLTTMHKVKGLEFDCVLIPPSFSDLPFPSKKIIPFEDQINEEKRLAFVAYTRARYRLQIFYSEREVALRDSKPFSFKKGIGIPAEPGIRKLNIGWAAKEFNFNTGVNEYIKKNLKSGDEIRIKLTPIAGFDYYELLDSKGKKVGQLSRPSGPPHEKEYQMQVALRQDGLSGFVINEVVQFSYDETLKSDERNGTKFAEGWCQEARNQGYIYLVDFAGFGISSDG